MGKSILYEWRCTECEHKFDRMAKMADRKTDCPVCGCEAKRLISRPRIDPKMGLDPDFPSAYDKWAKTRKQRTAIERKHYAEHGDDLHPGADIK